MSESSDEYETASERSFDDRYSEPGKRLYCNSKLSYRRDSAGCRTCSGTMMSGSLDYMYITIKLNPR